MLSLVVAGLQVGFAKLTRSRRAAHGTRFALPLLCWILLAAPAGAQVPEGIGLQGSVGYSYAGRPGYGLTVGAWTHWWMLVGLASLDLTVTMRESISCEEASNGRVVERGVCSLPSDTLVATMAELHLAPFEGVPLFFGGGIRSAPSFGPYAAMGFASPTGYRRLFWFARGALGRDFGQLHAGVGF